MNSKTKNCPGDEVLLQYVENRLAPIEYDELALHLHRCEECLQMVAVLLQANKNKTVESLHEEKEEEPKKKTFSADDYDEVIGARVGRYVIVEHIGSGGMGDVFKAYDPELDRKIALKLVHSELMDDSGSSAKARLMREAQAMAKLSHPNVVPVFDVQSVDDDVAIAMEFIDGVTLKEWLKQKKRNWSELADVFIQAGEGLQAAHEKGLIHRDFKPENVLIRKDGRVFVSDFGLVARSDDVKWSTENAIVRRQRPRNKKFLDANLTKSGALLGTPSYMSPEQYHSDCEIDPRSDQFSYCIVLFEALYGKRPFDGDSLEELKQRTISSDFSMNPKGRQVPNWLRNVVIRGLSSDPCMRFSSMKELLIAVRNNPKKKIIKVFAVLVSLFAVFATGLTFASGTRINNVKCEIPDEEFLGVWDQDVKTKLQNSFSSAKVPHSQEIFDRLSLLFDKYIEEWKAILLESCHNAHDRGLLSLNMLDLRVGCLQMKKEYIRALTRNLLNNVDERTIIKSLEAANKLPRLTRCVDNSILLSANAMMVAPEERKIVEQLAKTNLKLQALEKLGKYVEGVAASKDAYKQAKNTAYGPIIAKVLLSKGSLEEKSGQYQEAEKSTRAALRIASLSKDIETQADAFNSLLWIIGYKQERFEEITMMLNSFYETLLDSSGVDATKVSRFHDIVGSIRFREGKLEKAAERHKRAISILEYSKITNVHEVASAKHNYASVLWSKGDFKEALIYHQTALTEFQSIYGQYHPIVATVKGNLAEDLIGLGEYERARVLTGEALLTHERVLGPEHPSVWSHMHRLGRVESLQGEFNKAITYFKKALSIAKTRYNPTHSAVGRSHLGLAEAFESLGSLHRAHRHFEIAVRILSAKSGASSDLANARFGLAKILKSFNKDTERSSSLILESFSYYSAASHHKAQEKLAAIRQWCANRCTPEIIYHFKRKQQAK